MPRPSLSAVVVRRRDSSPECFRRFTAFTPKWRDTAGQAAGAKKSLTILASTAAAVDWGGWREVLVHDDQSVDTKAATALLLNHNPNRIIGVLSNIRITPEGMELDAELIPGAMMDGGVSVADAIESGALRGASIGYWYRSEDTTWDDKTDTLTVNRWRLLEDSLTPIPADDSAGLRTRSLPTIHQRATEPTNKETPMSFEQWLIARGLDLAKLTAPEQTALRALHAAGQEVPEGFCAHARIVAAVAPSEKRTAELMAEQREIAAQAKSLGLDAADFAGMHREAATQSMLTKMAGRDATKTPEVPVVQVGRDQADKVLSHARATLYSVGNIKPEDDAEAREIRGIRPMGMRQLMRLTFRSAGYHDADHWSDLELAARAHELIDLRTFGRRDAPNKVVANFSTLLANVANKAVQQGLSGFNAATWQIWCTQRNVANFLQVTNAGLASGRLTETAEAVAFPELIQKDGGYNSTLGLFGATVSISFQAMINDQLGQILGDLRRVGMIAAQTIDFQVYTKLLNATWTNDVSASAGLSTPSNLDKPRAALKNKTSPAGTGNKMGVVARYLLHDTANAVAAEVATGRIYGPGQTTAPSQGSRSIIPVESHWIGDTSIAGGALTTDYYLTGEPGIVDTVLVNFLEGLGFNPMIMPFDAGAVAAEKYKIMLPFQATVATHSDGTNTRISGMQKATVA